MQHFCRRSGTAGINYGQSSIIFGGNGMHGSLRSTEIITEQGVVSAGPDMPESSFAHCVASVNETTSILTGGWYTSGISAKTWFFSYVSQQFQAGPNLITGRYQHASATIQDKVTMENIVAVVGGGSEMNSYINTTELLINGESEWQQGKNHVK